VFEICDEKGCVNIVQDDECYDVVDHLVHEDLEKELAWLHLITKRATS